MHLSRCSKRKLENKMANMCGEVRLRKAEGERDIRKGQPIWLIGLKFVSVEGKGKPFGCAEQESKWPDLWVTVDVWNKEQFMDLEDKLDGKKRRIRCPKHLR